ncbi:hypothetical protein BT96DRAFT_913991 [Gymnopus androsaceus JB14]|uniref:Methyltransferase domain-containing protein n=1 Tax=Gymnopus androsaceus JB14 TaxID=1447944 RepID=A0A6A4I8Q2_9AGAR|nr:hypothetical protein BT96DRAFT_913991 [Gymnopus androsaceus JB14]
MENQTISPEMFTLNADELAFYTKHTGIQDQDKLKDHITEVAKKAFELFPYRCIKDFGFLRLLELGSTRKNALFLDLGCCFGNDIRKAIADGFPAENIIASDIRAEFWQFGHDLFNSSASTLPVTFIPGDVFDSSFISIQPPLKTLPTAEVESISLQSLLQAEPKSLNPLRGHISAIHTSAFFHLFNKDEQVVIAKKLASLALPSSGIDNIRLAIWGALFYSHSPESWKKMWEEEVFGMEEGEEGTCMIQVEAGLWDERQLWWIVTRL